MKSRAYARRIQAHALQGSEAPVPAAVGILYLSLCSGEPGHGDSQENGEIPGLSRAPVPRVAASWVEEGETFTNNALISFPKAGPYPVKRTATHWILGTSATGPGEAILSGKLESAQEIVSGMVLEFPPGSLRSDEF
jgi:hypothetical protein